MEKREFYLNSANRAYRLHVVEWKPEGVPRGVIQISHGIAEHIDRYDGYARLLAEQGYYVVGHDHLGHGTTAGDPESRGYTARKNGWFLMCNDLEVVRRFTRRTYPLQPYVLLGHSMGSFLARTYLIRFPGKMDGCILSGTGQVSGPLLKVGQAAAMEERLRLGEHGRSPVLQKLMFGAYNRAFAPNRTENDWISSEPDEVDRYEADELCGFVPTVRLVQDMLGGLDYIRQEKNLARMDKRTPILLYSGDHDPVGDFGKGVCRVFRRLVQAGCEDVTLKLYPNGRHEMHNEAERGRMYRDVLDWLNEKFGE